MEIKISADFIIPLIKEIAKINAQNLTIMEYQAIILSKIDSKDLEQTKKEMDDVIKKHTIQVNQSLLNDYPEFLDK